jgi:hypothetical protein
MPKIARRLFVVEGVFLIGPDGPVLVPGLKHTGHDDGVRVGDRIELRRPDGSVLVTRIHGINFPTPSKGFHPISLPGSVDKDDVPVGTEVWSSPDE